MSFRRIGVVLCVTTVMAAGRAGAQEADPWRFRQILVENDLFSIPLSRYGDRFYTNGIRVAIGKDIARPGDEISRMPLWTRPLRRYCSGCDIAPHLSFGHQIYSPEEIESPEPQIGDWPWSAWLYAGFGASVDTSARSRHDVEVQVGVTGDPALGKFGQEIWHGLTNSPDPKGWDNQIGPDPGINGYYSFQHILKEAADGRVVDWDFVPSVEAAVGTMNTYVGAGGTFRVGRHITDFPYAMIRVNERAASSGILPDLEIHGFVGGHVRAVAYNYFLEGSLFDEFPYTVEPHRYVWELRLGVTARFRRVNISYALTRRSKEFVRTAGDDRGIHTYGALSLTVGVR